MERCGYYVVEGHRVWIPHCWGSVVWGKHRCTCGSDKKDRLQLLEERIERLEEQLRQSEA